MADEYASSNGNGSCCCGGKNSNKVSPDFSVSYDSQVLANQFERINGWTCPWHPLQIIAWLFLIMFGVVHFGILVNYLPKEWHAAGYIVSFHCKIFVKAVNYINIWFTNAESCNMRDMNFLIYPMQFRKLESLHQCSKFLCIGIRMR